jgi:hypothetical protein
MAAAADAAMNPAKFRPLRSREIERLYAASNVIFYKSEVLLQLGVDTHVQPA